MNTHETDENVEKTLNLLQTQQKLETSPFFYTRLEAKLHSRVKQPTFQSSGVRVALLFTLLLIDIVAGYVVFRGNRAQQGSHAQLVSALRQEYQIQEAQSASSLLNSGGE